MNDIFAELKRVLDLSKENRGEFVISREYKDDREWWILGHFVKLMKSNSKRFPTYAIKTKPNDPDFLTYYKNKKSFKPIEISEILEPDRKRGKEYKRSVEIITPYIEEVKKVPEVWSSFKERLKKKFQKIYEKDCWLLLHHNISYSKITGGSGFWHNTVLANIEEWMKTGKIDFSKSTYEKIFVLNSSGKALIKIFPKFQIIAPERNNKGKTIILY